MSTDAGSMVDWRPAGWHNAAEVRIEAITRLAELEDTEQVVPDYATLASSRHRKVIGRTDEEIPARAAIVERACRKRSAAALEPT